MNDYLKGLELFEAKVRPPKKLHFFSDFSPLCVYNSCHVKKLGIRTSD